MLSEMRSPAIVIPAFNRPRSLRRLLVSIQEALHGDSPEIIISLEGGASSEVSLEAERFKDIYPKTTILYRKKRLGLRAHILSCGDVSLDHGSVILLEDDLMVDPQFYSYAKQAISFYANDDKVAGIALYAPEFNEFCGLRFTPMNSGFDTYFMRTPCSWGQIWTSGQWMRFREWYREADESSVQTANNLPSAVKDWPETSWKKYFAAYMSINELDFVYPYLSLSTNCADDGGTHVKQGSDIYQSTLPMPQRPLRKYQFVERNEISCVCYDEHMEADGCFIYEWLGLSRDAVTIDLYGTKSMACLSQRELVVTSKPVNAPEHCIKISFRPIEQNLRFLKGRRDDQSGYYAALSRISSVEWKRREWNVKKLEYFSGINLESGTNIIHLMGGVTKQLLSAVGNRVASVGKWLVR